MVVLNVKSGEHLSQKSKVEKFVLIHQVDIEILIDMRKIWHAGCTTANVRGSPKSVGFVLGVPWKSVAKFMAIHLIAIFGISRPTDTPTLPSLKMASPADVSNNAKVFNGVDKCCEWRNHVIGCSRNGEGWFMVCLLTSKHYNKTQQSYISQQLRGLGAS